MEEKTECVVNDEAKKSGLTLPSVLDGIALLLAFISIIGTVALAKYEVYWAIPYTVGALISSPFLLGFSDIVENVRVIASKK